MKKVDSGAFDVVVEQILEIEVKMFVAVMVETEPDCRSRIKEMRLHRSSQFAGWSVATLASYLEDLRRADKTGENLMTLKYARMGNSIPRLSRDPRITEILEICVAWQKIFIQNYPNIMKGGRDIDDFRNYFRAELETYSTETLKLLRADVEKYEFEDRSMVREIYERMSRLAGYESIDDMESSFSDLI